METNKKTFTLPAEQPAYVVPMLKVVLLLYESCHDFYIFNKRSTENGCKVVMCAVPGVVVDKFIQFRNLM